jgi:hypothetical protein
LRIFNNETLYGFLKLFQHRLLLLAALSPHAYLLHPLSLLPKHPSPKILPSRNPIHTTQHLRAPSPPFCGPLLLPLDSFQTCQILFNTRQGAHQQLYVFIYLQRKSRNPPLRFLFHTKAHNGHNKCCYLLLSSTSSRPAPLSRINSAPKFAKP